MRFSEQLHSVHKQLISDHREILDGQLCSIDARVLALATNSHLIKLYSLDLWHCQLLRGHTDLVLCLSAFVSARSSSAVDQHVTYLASSSKDTTIRIWRIVQSDEQRDGRTIQDTVPVSGE